MSELQVVGALAAAVGSGLVLYLIAQIDQLTSSTTTQTPAPAPPVERPRPRAALPERKAA